VLTSGDVPSSDNGTPNCLDAARNSCSGSFRKSGPANESWESGDGARRQIGGACRERACLRLGFAAALSGRGETNDTVLLVLGMHGDVVRIFEACVLSIVFGTAAAEDEGLWVIGTKAFVSVEVGAFSFCESS
jgi:hypothetical protein